MTNNEQAAICKAIAVSCMWGNGGIGSVILDTLQRVLPMEQKWRTVFNENVRAAQQEAVGIITDEAELRRWTKLGYWLTNYEPDRVALFNPPPMNGLFMYVTRAVADKYKSLWSGWPMTSTAPSPWEAASPTTSPASTAATSPDTHAHHSPPDTPELPLPHAK